MADRRRHSLRQLHPSRRVGGQAGYSIDEVIDTAQRATGRRIAVNDAPRRAGDPSVLVTDPTLARGELNWEPKFPALNDIIAHAWTWEWQRGRWIKPVRVLPINGADETAFLRLNDIERKG